jgi:hypothetical protein
MIRATGPLPAVIIIATCFACTTPPAGNPMQGNIPSNVQIPSPDPGVARFDGAYQFVSGELVSESPMNMWQRMVGCPDPPIEGPLTIVNGQATYIYGRHGRQFRGTVEAGGQLRFTDTDFITHGVIDDSGTMRARQTSDSCSFDLVWQKAPR